MATRFYLHSSPTTLGAPIFNAGWLSTTSARRFFMSTVRKNSSFFVNATSSTSSTAVQDSLSVQFISDPIKAQTISGTVKGVVRTNEDSATTDARAQLAIYVWDRSLTVLRGTLLTFSAAALASEFTVTPIGTNRKFPLAWVTPVAMTSVIAQEGDRVVIEVGWRKHAAVAVRSCDFEFGDNSASDLAEDETSTAQNNPWFEISDTLTFLSDTTERRGENTSLISQLNQAAKPPVQSRGDSYENTGPLLSPDSVSVGRRGFKGVHSLANSKNQPTSAGEGASYLGPYPLLSPDSVSGERRGFKATKNPANAKGIAPSPGSGSSYVEPYPRNSPNSLRVRLRPDWRSEGDDLTSGMAGFPGENPLKFAMKAWNTTLLQFVYWTARKYPDFLGDFSGYPLIQLQNIAVIPTYT